MKEYLEKDNYVLCPVCRKEKFNLDDYFIFCNHCGWEGNINVDEKIVELNGMSTKDYRKVYDEYIKIHPSFVWSEDKDALDNYISTFKDYGSKCPVCGEDSFEPDYRYCYKCGWKYNYVQAQYSDYCDSSNELSLNQYREKYKSIIGNSSDYLWKNTNDVKIPFTNEQIKWLKENHVKIVDKLTDDKELHQILDSIYKIQTQYENKENYEIYMFIKDILDLILDTIYI